MNSRQRRTRWRAILKDPGFFARRFGLLRIWQKRIDTPIPYEFDAGRREQTSPEANGFAIRCGEPDPRFKNIY